MLAIGLVALLIWAAFFFFCYRRLDRTGTAGREDDIRFALDAAPWSDRHVESLLARSLNSPTLLGQYVANAVERSDWPEALRRADIFTTRSPRSAYAWLARIDILRRAGREEEAVAALRKAVRRMPRAPEILLVWAREAARSQDWAEASRRFARMRRFGPGHVEGYHEAAEVLIKDGRSDEAAAVIAEGMGRLSENWTMLRAAAWIAERMGDDDEAIRRWEAMRARVPGEPSGFLCGAEALVRAGRGEEAVALIRQARDFFPGNKTVAEAAARLAPPEAPEPAEPPSP